MEIIIGRGAEGEQQFDLSNTKELGVSRKHCRVRTIDAGTVEIEDFSSFGTYICNTENARNIPLWNPKKQMPPKGLTKVNGKARASIDDTLFLGPKIHGTIRELLIPKGGIPTEGSNTSTEVCFTTQTPSFNPKQLNLFNHIADMVQEYGSRIFDIKENCRNSRPVELTAKTLPMVLAACAAVGIEKGDYSHLQEAQKDLYEAGDLMYGIAVTGDRESTRIYGEIMVILCEFYKKIYKTEELTRTAEAAAGIFQHLKDESYALEIKRRYLN